MLTRNVYFTSTVLCLTSFALAEDGERVFPGTSWPTKRPHDVGLDDAKLDAFAKAIGGDGVVIRDGYLMKTWGRPDKRADWASSAKPVISTLPLFAVHEGKLKSVDDPVRPWVQKRWPEKDLSEKDRAMTFRHLADMTSGYSRAELAGGTAGRVLGLQRSGNQSLSEFDDRSIGRVAERRGAQAARFPGRSVLAQGRLRQSGEFSRQVQELRHTGETQGGRRLSDPARYYREIIARFGDLPALIFNMGEEHNENYKLADGLALAQQLADIDPYDHPRGIHNVNSPNNAYIDAPQIDFTAIQTGSPGTRRGLENALQHNQLAIEWLRRCESRGKRMLMVNFDEGRPEETRAAWWAVYLAGGVRVAHVLPPCDRPMSAWEKTWNELGGARAFMESLPFWELQPQNELVKGGKAFCLAKPGEAYALYLPEGGKVAVELTAETEYTVDWWNPTNTRDGSFVNRKILVGATQTLVAPSTDDWAVRITKHNTRR